MYPELIDLNFSALSKVTAMYNSLQDSKINPIVNSLIEKFNKGISTGDVLESRSWKKPLNWWSNKSVLVNSTYFLFEEETPTDVYGYDIARRLKEIFIKKYPLALLDIRAERVKDKTYWRYSIDISFREDGKPFIPIKTTNHIF